MNMMNKVFSAEQLAIKDPLRDKAQAFSLPANPVYLAGHSLGPRPKAREQPACGGGNHHGGKGAHSIHKGICSKLNIIARLEFELATTGSSG